MDGELHIDDVGFLVDGTVSKALDKKISGNKANANDIADESWEDEQKAPKKEIKFALAKKTFGRDLTGEEAYDDGTEGGISPQAKKA